MGSSEAPSMIIAVTVLIGLIIGIEPLLKLLTTRPGTDN